MSVHEICALSFRTFHSEKYADDYNKGQEKSWSHRSMDISMHMRERLETKTGGSMQLYK